MASDEFDLVVIGGGIIGLATALHLVQRFPKARMAVLEKEPDVARHQSGHNSGVIHSGIYYRPGSAKARLCVSGRTALLRFCDEHDIPYELCGKVIVATAESQLGPLETLWQRGTENGVSGLKILGPEEIKDIEPYGQGLKALYCPATGIVDFAQVARAMADDFRHSGGTVLLSCSVNSISRTARGWTVRSSLGELASSYLINCSGLFSDRVAMMARPPGAIESTLPSALQIVPFRGEFFRLIPEKRHLVRGLIYPVPDPSLPFLGVHCSRTVRGEVELGPNAVLALAREGYRKRDIDLGDLWQFMTFQGFWSLAGRHWKSGLGEFHRSMSKRAFVRDLQKLIPEVKPEDLEPARSGVRAQAVAGDGRLLDDFVIESEPKAIHVLNAPSPGATASLAIGAKIGDMASETFSPPLKAFQ